MNIQIAITKEMEDWGDDLIHARAQAGMIEEKTGKPALNNAAFTGHLLASFLHTNYSDILT